MDKYGKFDDKAREYVIKEHFTPLPWINFLTNDNFTAIISQAGGGCAFYREASTGRLTKYNQTRAIPVDRPGYYLYIRESDGKVWSPTYEPVRAKLSGWKCRHGLGYTTYHAQHRKLNAELTYFVPRNDDALLWNMKLTNNRDTAVDLTSFAFVEFSFLLAIREPQYWQWCRFYTSTTFDKSLDAVKYDYHVYEDQPKLKIYLTSSLPVSGFDCDRNSFLGRGGTLDMPAAVKEGKLACKELPGGGFPIAALENKIHLEPGQTIEFTVNLCCSLSWEKSAGIVKKYKDNAVVQDELAKVKNYWADYLDVYQADLPDKDFQRMVNIWNPYNCSIAFNRKKSMTGMTTGMEKGGVQSRDSSQDSMSLISLRTDLAKERMEIIYRYQMPSGEYYSSFDPDHGKPSDFYAVRSDNGVWPVYTTYDYVAETGDISFLEKKIPYWQGEDVSIVEHMVQGLKHIASKRGKNNLPLIIEIDWNDNLYIFHEDGKEESVMLAQQLVYACRLLKEMALKVNRGEIVKWCDGLIEEMTRNLNTDGVWDGEWYKRYIYSSNKPALGSKDRREAKIFINTQSWAVISDTAVPASRAQMCMEQAHKRCGTKFGLKLCSPPFTGIPEPEDPLYNNGPGIRENGGVFNHAHTWAVMAETILRRGDKAYELYRQVLPNVSSRERGEDVYVNEPYAFSSTSVVDPDPREGEGDMAWFSGTVTWMYLVGTQYILGIRPELDGLLIDPCIPSTWGKFTVKREFRGVIYTIKVKNPNHVSTGIKSIKVDGVKIEGNVLPESKDKKEVVVDVVMG